ncbi:MAG: B12-binding domain-containing radical SAM protein [Candidatus Anammoxibacter sp.]
MKNNFALISLYSTENLGVRFLTSYLRSQGVDVSIIFFKDMFYNDAKKATQKEKDLLINTLKEINPGIAGISVGCSALAKTATDITREIQDELGVPVIWGGPHATILPEESIKAADFVCIGEGENLLLKLLNSLSDSRQDISSVPNLWFKQNGEVIFNEIEPVDQTFCNLPAPDYSNENKFFISRDSITEGDPFRDAPYVYITLTAKGCRYLCTYCSNNLFMKIYGGKKVYFRRRSVNKIIEELVSVKKEIPGIRMIQFYDDEFASDMDWIIEFSERYKEEIDLPFWCFFHPFGINEKSIKNLKQAGLRQVIIGCQSGSAYVRKKIYHRPESDKKISSVVKLLNQNGVIPKIDLIFDNPFETEEHKEEAVRFLLELERPFHFHLYSLLFLPKTRLTERALNEKIITEDNIEGKSEKTLSQVFFSPSYPRAKSEFFWICITSLIDKSFIPKSFIRYLSGKEWLKNNPKPLYYLANVANLVRLGQIGIAAGLRGQLTFSFVKKYIRHFLSVGT